MSHPASFSELRLLANCEIQQTRRGGPGGQHRNKVSTAIVIQHLPTGVTAEASERRSQMMNRHEALERLRKALKALTFVAAPRVKTKVTRSQKRRRLDNKKRNSDKKRDRRGDW